MTTNQFRSRVYYRSLAALSALLLSMPAVLLTALTSHAQEFDLDTLFESAEADRLAELQKLRVDASTRDTKKQTEAPAMSSNSTSLLDTTSASDLIGVAVNLSDLGVSSESDGGEDATAFSATVSAYAITSLLKGFDPLSPDRYCDDDSQKARMLSVTLGRENAEDGKETGVIAGVKFRLPFGDTLCSTQAFSKNGSVYNAAFALGAADGASSIRLHRALVAAYGEQILIDKFGAEDAGDPGIPELVWTNGDEEDRIRMREIAKGLADNSISRKAGLDKTLATEIERLTEGPQFAVEFLTTQRDDANTDLYVASVLFDYDGVLENIDFSANAGWQMNEEPGGNSTHGGTAALAFKYAPTDSFLYGRRPIRVSVTGRAEWKAKEDDVYKGQAKLVLPVIEGIELPISITVSSRTDLIDETDVRGQVGFTIDTASILNRLR